MGRQNVVVVAVPKSKGPALLPSPSLSCPVPLRDTLKQNGRRVLLPPQAIKSGPNRLARTRGNDVCCLMPALALHLTATSPHLQ